MLFFGALLVSTVHAAVIQGGDWGGADLVVANGDILSGTFTNVGRFEVPSTAYVRVDRGVPLRVIAEEVVIDGELSAMGSGFEGGTSDEIGDDGSGPGAGSGSGWGTGGGGGGYGGEGGGADEYCKFGTCPGIGAFGGPSYTPFRSGMGSGGGGGASHYDQSKGLGGDGGGGILLMADEIRIDGRVDALGTTGGCPDNSSVFDGGGGGGGSGGLIRLRTAVLSGAGDLSVRGGDSCGQWNPGGGGGGGWVFIEGSSSVGALSVMVEGGFGAHDGQPGRLVFDLDLDRVFDADELVLGTDPASADTDGDGLLDGQEVRQGTDPLVADTDADGLDDGADTCPLDPDNDIDGDGVCGEVDNCPLDPNAAQRDADGDGIGAPCDLCFGDNASGDTDGDGDCDDTDNCPLDANGNQGDGDGDGIGNVCDLCFGDNASGDTDGDGACDDLDVCPHVFDPDQLDTDIDGFGDACDTCATVYNPAQEYRFVPNDAFASGDFGARWVDITAADIDGDGLTDVAGVTEDSGWYYLNGAHARIIVARPGMQAVALDDIDGDDVPEFLRGGPGRVAWYTWHGFGAGIDWTFLMPAVSFRTDVVDLELDDIDGDGVRDVLIVDRGLGELVWHQHLGAGAYGAEQLIDTGLSSPHAAAFGDVDDDGDDDLLLANTDADEVVWYERLAGGLSAGSTACSVDAPGDVAAADVDGDDLDDIVAYSLNGDLAWCPALAGGGFGPAQSIGTSLGSMQLAVGDIDGDGDPDLLTGGHWFENLGGSFAAGQAVLEGSPVAELADMDGDGDLDALAAEGDDRWLWWYENQAPVFCP